MGSCSRLPRIYESMRLVADHLRYQTGLKLYDNMQFMWAKAALHHFLDQGDLAHGLVKLSDTRKDFNMSD